MLWKRLIGSVFIAAPFIWVLWSLIAVLDWHGLIVVLSVVTGIVACMCIGVWLLLAEE